MNTEDIVIWGEMGLIYMVKKLKIEPPVLFLKVWTLISGVFKVKLPTQKKPSSLHFSSLVGESKFKFINLRSTSVTFAGPPNSWGLCTSGGKLMVWRLNSLQDREGPASICSSEVSELAAKLQARVKNNRNCHRLLTAWFQGSIVACLPQDLICLIKPDLINHHCCQKGSVWPLLQRSPLR